MSRIDARELLDEARALSAGAYGEDAVVRRRTVVGRAYYAAYHACLSVAGQLGFDPKERFRAVTGGRSPGVHGFLIGWLCRFNHRTVQGLGRELGRLKEYRTAADYDDPFSPPTVKDVQAVVKIAARLVESQCPTAIRMILPHAGGGDPAPDG